VGRAAEGGHGRGQGDAQQTHEQRGITGVLGPILLQGVTGRHPVFCCHGLHGAGRCKQRPASKLGMGTPCCPAAVVQACAKTCTCICCWLLPASPDVVGHE
jgi:hypothetical protein